MMDLLFNIGEQQAPDIEGLHYIPAFITKEEEQALIEAIDQSSWLTDLKRRVQHYGYKYDYKARAVTDDAYIGELPDWIVPIAKRLQEQGVFKTIPDQAIVNEYEPGQGISAHVDCIPCFGEMIASLTLGSGAIMQFQSAVVVRRIISSRAQFDRAIRSGSLRMDACHSCSQI